MNLTPIALGLGGPYDIAIIAGVIVLLFGGAKVADLFKGMGEGVREFKKAAQDDPSAATEPAVRPEKS